MMRTSFAIVIGAALLAATACGKGDKNGSGGGGGGGGGGVDKETWDKLTGGIQSGSDFAKTSADIDKVLGPVKVKKDDRWIWAVDNGTDCYELKLMKAGEDKVAGWGGGKVNKMVEDQYAKCAKRAKGE
jgi:hypothetical protein